MTGPAALPVSGSTSWFPWGQSVDYRKLAYTDVRDWGGKVDGSTDDTAAARLALNAFSTSGTSDPGSGGIVYVPPGYMMTSGTLDVPSNIHFRGAGKSATCIQLLPNSNCHILTTHRSTGSGNSNAFWTHISDMMLDGRRANQGATLTDVTMRPSYTTLTSAGHTFAANGTLISGIGLLPGTTIVSGGGTNTAVISQAPTVVALQQAPGSAVVYQGGTVDLLAGNPMPWCGIYHETNPYNSAQSGDTQYDPTHIFERLRIYFMNGDGVRIHGRSDVTCRDIKVTVPTANGFTVDFDTIVTDCMTERTHAHGIEVPGHSSDRITGNKLYNSYGAGIYIHGGTGGEITCAGNDLQQNCWDGLRIESQTGVHFSGAISDSGFSNALGGDPQKTTWAASTAYGSFWNGPHADVVVPTSPNGYVYAVYIAGTSGTVQPTWPTTAGSTVTDGSVTWVTLARMPAAVHLSDATDCIVDAVAAGDLNGLRVLGASSANALRVSHTRGVLGSVDLSADSIPLTGTTNDVTLNGVNLAGLNSLGDVAVSAPANGNVLTYSSSTGKWGAAAGGGGGGSASATATVARLTSGDLSLVNQNWTAVNAALDLTLAAGAGNWLVVDLNAKVLTETASELWFDMATMVGSTMTNWVTSGTAASGSHFGAASWTMAANYRGPISGTYRYQLQAGDISGGNVVVRLFFSTSSATVARSVGASAPAAGFPLVVSGQVF